MKIVGLTGGIGSGKTTVANMFAEEGVPIYIADIEARNLSNTLPIIREEIIEIFGEAAYQNSILDRKFIADKVFNNTGLLEKLNSIIHPRIAEHFKEWTSKQNATYVIKEAAILFENGGYKECDYNILVTAPKKTRIERILARDETTESDILKRMENQWSDERKEKFADFTIINIDLESTRNAVKYIHKSLLEMI
ncbi:dephospho-CoA kinase [Aequorivita echinoideorum]|uniref:Dephospho-CoA kinase n=1 Tax=Aequorivita echinoideorum TaxID=1549647 RepID=A0ABS5S5Z6_9FLAO|nr:dephospho-CoA kinase [Aequorivita echinoideorum]MBT0608604.1 dephospho-CoA kinase [Aequorivita echinoideorum]